uniref:tRNA (adenosine(37)-N6)-threonylcarbamoyltransferase complex transferase subunit TsaD n=1 Tax=Gemmiger formicilis TaxID=745368 RepID=UPI0040252833
MYVLGIESTCDETAAAIVEDGRKVISNVISTSVKEQALYGGVVPEIASRRHAEYISATVDKALADAGMTMADVDAVAVTFAPGLIGAVLVGVNFAKAAAYALDLPLVPVHHIRGHIAANYLAYPELEPPFICLVVSGGHTLIVDVRGYTDFRVLGTTRDDAAGECFDKVARVLGMPYPGGAALDRCAKTGDEEKYPLPHTKLSGNPLDMSFSGLKTAALNLIHMHEQKGESVDVPSLCASFSKAVSEMLVPRTMQALKESGYKKLAIAGGVAANSRIRADFKAACESLGAALYTPPLSLCGDNGAMIGSQGYYEFLAGTRAGQDLNAFATRSIEQPYE